MGPYPQSRPPGVCGKISKSVPRGDGKRIGCSGGVGWEGRFQGKRGREGAEKRLRIQKFSDEDHGLLRAPGTGGRGRGKRGSEEELCLNTRVQVVEDGCSGKLGLVVKDLTVPQTVT